MHWLTHSLYAGLFKNFLQQEMGTQFSLELELVKAVKERSGTPPPLYP